MHKSSRMFDIIQILRQAKQPVTAGVLATRLEVTKRTVYRDVVSLQAAGVPIEGAAGVGYIMRRGFDLPPLMFTADQIEAIVVGLSLIGRTGDETLEEAGREVLAKIAAILPQSAASPDRVPLLVSRWNAIPPTAVSLELLRRAIRDNRKLDLRYRDGEGRQTTRIVCPLSLVYYIDGIVLAAWCDLRQDFRHFRNDRIEHCDLLDENFSAQADVLRQDWQRRHPPFTR